MSVCKCPACQSQFQAPDDRLATHLTCPDCRFQVSVPELKLDQPAVVASDMITCECTACHIKFQVPQAKGGTLRRCPDCGQPVPAVETNGLRQVLWLTVFAIVLAPILFLTCMIGV